MTPRWAWPPRANALRHFAQAAGRPGITIDDMATLLAAFARGLELRMIGDPSDRLIDHDRRRTLLGAAALAVIHSFLEPDCVSAALTLEQAVDDMIHRAADAR